MRTIFALLLTGLFLLSTSSTAEAAAGPSLQGFLDDMAASFSDPVRFRALAGATIFDRADHGEIRTFGTPRVVSRSADGQSAIVLLSATVKVGDSGDQTSISNFWSGLYRVTHSPTGWNLADRLPFGVNQLLEHHISVAIDPAVGLVASDRLIADVAGDTGFAIMLNCAAQISAISVDGKIVSFDFQNGLLWLDAVNGRHQIDISYQISVEHPETGGNSAAFMREAGHVRSQYFWHPFFGFGEERGRAPIFVRATIPDRFRVALGIPQTDGVVNGVRTVEGQSSGPIDAVTLAYDSEWNPRTVKAGDVTLTLFAKSDFTPSIDVIDDAFARAIRVLSTRFGAPSLDSISIIQGRARGRNGWHFFSNQGIFAGVQGGVPVRETEFPTRVFLGHEIAHLWTHPTGWARHYLAEGWATYAESLMLADEFGPDAAKQFWRDQARLQRQSQEDMNTAIDNDPGNAGVAYAKGAWTLRMLERFVGRADFDRAIRAYVASPAAYSSYDSFLDGFGLQRTRVEAFLKPWLSEKGLPSLSVRQANSKLFLVQTGPTYIFPAFEIRLIRRDGTSHLLQIDITKRTTQIALDPDVTSIELDPFEDFLLEKRLFVVAEAATAAEIF